MEIETFASDHSYAKIGIYPSSEHYAKEVLLRIRCAPDEQETLTEFDQLVDRLRQQIVP